MGISTIIALAVTTVVTTVIGVLVRGPVQQAIARTVSRMAKNRALGRVRSEPYYRVGQCIQRAHTPGVAEPLVEDYYIAELGVGRVVLRSLDDNYALPMTCMEFEALHVVMRTDRAMKDGRLRDTETGKFLDIPGVGEGE